ncbi:TPA: hypothetical protein ACODIZ_003712 [Salmonella enterica subsp. enterica serovar Newport]
MNIFKIALVACVLFSPLSYAAEHAQDGQYFCENGFTVIKSGEKIAIFDQDNNGGLYQELDSQPVADAITYKLADVVVQAYASGNDVTINFGHGFDFQCSKSR